MIKTRYKKPRITAKSLKIGSFLTRRKSRDSIDYNGDFLLATICSNSVCDCYSCI